MTEQNSYGFLTEDERLIHLNRWAVDLSPFRDFVHRNLQDGLSREDVRFS